MLSSKQGSSFFLWYTSLIAACGGFLFGYDMVVISGTVGAVKEQFSLSGAAVGVFVSCAIWGCAIGAGVAGFFADTFGRKRILIVASLLIFISAVWTGLASSPTTLVMARLLGGMGIGMAAMVCPLYISEIAPKDIRGRMVSLFQFTITIGLIVCVIANWQIFSSASDNMDNTELSEFYRWLAVDENWRLMFMAEALPAIVFFICSFFIPESPRWLVQQDKQTQALHILSKINGQAKAEEICVEIEEVLQQEKGIKFSDLFTHKLKKPLVLCLLIAFFAEVCGASAVFYYGPSILEASGFGQESALGGFGIIAIVNFLATILALKYIDKLGRRKLLAIGTIGCLLTDVVIGLFFQFNVSGLPIVIAINVFVAFFACSIGPIKFVIVSEVFPNSIRGRAIALASFSIFFFSAINSQLFPMMQEVMDESYIFYIFAGLSLFALPVIKYYMPETKGMTIEQIEKSWLVSNR